MYLTRKQTNAMGEIISAGLERGGNTFYKENLLKVRYASNERPISNAMSQELCKLNLIACSTAEATDRDPAGCWLWVTQKGMDDWSRAMERRRDHRFMIWAAVIGAVFAVIAAIATALLT